RALAQWLLAPAEASQILDRQAAARDLRERLDLREAWAVMGDDDEVRVQPEALHDWAETPSRLDRRWIKPAAWAVPVIVGGTAAVWAIVGLASPFVLALLTAFGFMRSLKAPLDEILRGIENGAGDLK